MRVTHGPGIVGCTNAVFANVTREFLIGYELIILSNKFQAHLIHISCLAHTQMTNNTKKICYTLVTLVFTKCVSLFCYDRKLHK